MKILVTGGMGFLGHHVVSALLNREHQVTVLDNMIYARRVRSASMAPGAELILGDIRDTDSVVQLVDTGFDRVINLAAIVGERACGLNVDYARSINVEAVARLLSRTPNTPAFLISTCSVFGADAAERSATDMDLPVPSTPYAFDKFEMERVAQSAGNNAVTVLRFASLFGWSARPRTDLVINAFCYQARKTGVIRVNGTGDQVRPFLHVSDAAAMLAEVVSNPSPVSETIGLGRTSQNYTINDLAQMVSRATGARIDVSPYMNPGDARSYRVDFTDTESRFNFAPSLEFGQTIVQMCAGDDALEENEYWYDNYLGLRSNLRGA